MGIYIIFPIFLTWYANIPEFTQWYYPRIHGEWKVLFNILIIFHFVLPLFGFMSRHIKRNALSRILFCLMIIVIHYFDIRFLIYPNFMSENNIVFEELALIISFAFILFGVIFYRISSYRIIPINDPRLNESKNWRMPYDC